MFVWAFVCLFAPFGLAQTPATAACGDEEIGRLTADEVTVSEVSAGIFQGSHRYRITCGPWSVEAILRKTPSIALQINSKEGDPIRNVPAQAAFRLYRLPLGRLLADQKVVQSYGLTVRGYQELGDRLANAASISDSWNSRLGRPRSAVSISSLVKDLMDKQQLYPELVALAGQFGYEVRVSGVEKVELCRDPSSTHTGPSHRGRVPCGGLITFRMIEKGKDDGRTSQK
ncbi:MAG TPA: hypothetical protein VE377_08990 [Candidatus Dormibacteraeota bacterium]|nr:hypothetical protein [Candidatus Dormibacteraeota bacterium]